VTAGRPPARPATASRAYCNPCSAGGRRPRGRRRKPRVSSGAEMPGFNTKRRYVRRFVWNPGTRGVRACVRAAVRSPPG
jgi:hypothetical protein